MAKVEKLSSKCTYALSLQDECGTEDMETIMLNKN